MSEKLTIYQCLRDTANKCIQAEDKEKAEQYMKSFSDLFMSSCIAKNITPEEARDLIPVIRSLGKHFKNFNKMKKNK